MSRLRRRRVRLVATLIVTVVSFVSYQTWLGQTAPVDLKPEQSAQLQKMYQSATEKLDSLEVKGRAPKTGYSRAQFGDGWDIKGACDVRNIILNRDLQDVIVDSDCKVLEGVLNDPYTGGLIQFRRGASTSDDVQIDHVVALSDAWQKGAQALSFDRRVEFANDPLNLLAVDGPANQQKSDSDAATWLPPNRAFRCQYVSRQIEVKAKYDLWVTRAEEQAMHRVLKECL